MAIQNEPVGATSAQLRDDITSGRSGDKVPGFDPAMSPLGTDDEAGGNSLSPLEIAEMRRQEVSRGPEVHQPNGSQPQMQPNGNQAGWGKAMPIILGAAAAVALGAALVASI